MSIREALTAALSDPILTSASNRSRVAVAEARVLVQKLDNSEFSTFLEDFSKSHFDVLKRVCLTAERCSTTKAVSKQKLWEEFHRVRLTTLDDLWEAFLSKLKSNLHSLVRQYVNERILKSLIMSITECGNAAQPAPPSAPSVAVALSSEEENIIRYAAGYVPYSLLKKYGRYTVADKSLFISCLKRLAANDGCEVEGQDPCFLDYTTTWVRSVTRGGLFQVNDVAYTLFREIEKATRQSLTGVLASRQR